ncbi:MAG TPA: DUF6526 family protein [Terriglobales bacterium]|nr:DUF6526 family protein [Terriglobales bacterium]
MPTPQSYANYTRWDPPFHFFILPVFIIAVITAIVHAATHFTRHPIHSTMLVLFALATLAAVFKIRLNALKVQDRVIRLEERLRLATILPEPLRSRIPELTESQLIGLRFASDGELPALVQRALTEKISSAEIKKSIQTWRPDNFRV